MTNHRQQIGFTLIECLVSIALSAVMLAGLASVMNIALSSYQQNQQFAASHSKTEEVLERIAWAIETAELKKKSSLSAKTGTHTSGDWFYGKNPDNSVRVIEYTWSSANRVLNEMDSAKIPHALLSNVTNFSVTAPDTTGDALILVSLSVQSEAGITTYHVARRLGNAW